MIHVSPKLNVEEIKDIIVETIQDSYNHIMSENSIRTNPDESNHHNTQ